MQECAVSPRLMSHISKKVENYIFNLFKTGLPPEVVYHNFEHTNQVVQHAFEIGVYSDSLHNQNRYGNYEISSDSES